MPFPENFLDFEQQIERLDEELRSGYMINVATCVDDFVRQLPPQAERTETQRFHLHIIANMARVMLSLRTDYPQPGMAQLLVDLAGPQSIAHLFRDAYNSEATEASASLKTFVELKGVPTAEMIRAACEELSDSETIPHPDCVIPILQNILDHRDLIASNAKDVSAQKAMSDIRKYLFNVLAIHQADGYDESAEAVQFIMANREAMNDLAGQRQKPPEKDELTALAEWVRLCDNANFLSVLKVNHEDTYQSLPEHKLVIQSLLIAMGNRRFKLAKAPLLDILTTEDLVEAFHVRHKAGIYANKPLFDFAEQKGIDDFGALVLDTYPDIADAYQRAQQTWSKVVSHCAGAEAERLADYDSQIDKIEPMLHFDDLRGELGQKLISSEAGKDCYNAYVYRVIDGFYSDDIGPMTTRSFIHSVLENPQSSNNKAQLKTVIKGSDSFAEQLSNLSDRDAIKVVSVDPEDRFFLKVPWQSPAVKQYILTCDLGM